MISYILIQLHVFLVAWLQISQIDSAREVNDYNNKLSLNTKKKAVLELNDKIIVNTTDQT